jgi:uncharacterized membrane protein YccC
MKLSPFNFSGAGRRAALWLGNRGPEFRLAARITAAALLAFAIGRALGLQQGYWAVFTAIVVMQAAVGGSFIAALDYFVGTIAGAVYGTVVALILPLENVGLLGVAIAISVGPLAFLAAVRRNFRAAPITAVIILIIPALQHVSILDSALGRVLEIAIGSGTGILVGRFVFPARTRRIVGDTAAQILRLSARMAALLFAGFGEKRDLTAIVKLQDGYRRLLIRLDAVVAEAARERANYFSSDPDAEPILRTLRRLRFDYVIIGRAAATPLHDATRAHLLPPLERVSNALRDHLADTAQALEARREPPSLDAATESFAAYAAAMSTLRREGLTRDLSDQEVSRIFTLGFALEQLRRNLGDLHNRVAELARGK